MKIAAIGDIHGCIDELKDLYTIIYPLVDEVWSVGDLVDRGPDSGACVQFCIDNNIKAVMGNHEWSILPKWDNYNKNGHLTKNPDKARTVLSLSKDQAEWIRRLPFFHIHDATKTILVHGGMWPKLEWWKQPHNVIRAQMIHPLNPGASRWWGPAAKERFGKTEQDFYNEGYRRWYQLWDHEYNVVFGHSVFTQPLLQKNSNSGYIIGTDTGSCFGGSLTAAIIETDKRPYFISVKMHKVYCEDKLDQFGDR